MTKFRVPVIIEFYGEVVVDAETEESAEDIATAKMEGTITAYATSDSIIDYSINQFGYATRDYNSEIVKENKNESD